MRQIVKHLSKAIDIRAEPLCYGRSRYGLEGRGEDIAAWAADSGLCLLNTVDNPTNAHGNTIDLAFTNVPLGEAAVEDHLATSSDHFTLSLTLPALSPAPLQPGKVRLTSDEELKRFVELVEMGAPAIPLAASTSEELDALALALVGSLQSAAKAVGRPVRKGARSAPWWSEDCASAAAEYRAIRSIYPLGFNQDVQYARRGFRRAVRRAKRLYWRNLIDSVSDSASVFKSERYTASPSQQSDGRVSIVSQLKTVTDALRSSHRVKVREDSQADRQHYHERQP